MVRAGAGRADHRPAASGAGPRLSGTAGSAESSRLSGTAGSAESSRLSGTAGSAESSRLSGTAASAESSRLSGTAASAESSRAHATAAPITPHRDAAPAAPPHYAPASAARFLDALADRLAIGVASVVAILDPGCVVLGGEVGQAGGEELAGRVEERIRRMSPLATIVRPSGLGGAAVLRGALLTARDAAQDELFTPPDR
ncbi:ROK family protein [Streptomyces sp. NPDC048581]|uniref:ROK family protein n=1 Tax=Streptomyces sp. NPDC048581 TaxID=3365572 RepID=UPI00371B8E64